MEISKKIFRSVDVNFYENLNPLPPFFGQPLLILL